MTLILTLHSILRWLITLIALAAIVRCAVGWIARQPFDSVSRGLAAGFSGLLDLQAMLGGLYLVVSGVAGTGFPIYRLEHAGIMLLAVMLAHLPARWKDAPDDLRHRNTLLTFIAVVLVIAAGILPIGGWSRWWHITGLF